MRSACRDLQSPGEFADSSLAEPTRTCFSDSRMLRTSAFLWALTIGSLPTSVTAGSKLKESLLPEKDAIPDLTQTDPKGNFAGGGKNFCAPVAVSNSFMAIYADDLKWNDVTHYDLVNKLASLPFMNTDFSKGTNVRQLMRGVEHFLRERGEKDYYLKFQGWRRHDNRHRTGISEPQFSWIKHILSQNGSVWLNVGWYQRTPEENTLKRIGGHWVTAVGYGQTASGTSNSAIIVIHDPAPRAGMVPDREFVKLTRIEHGILRGTMRNLPRPARNLYRMEGGMHVKPGAHFAILDGAVGLRLKPKTPVKR